MDSTPYQSHLPNNKKRSKKQIEEITKYPLNSNNSSGKGLLCRVVWKGVFPRYPRLVFFYFVDEYLVLRLHFLRIILDYDLENNIHGVWLDSGFKSYVTSSMPLRAIL